MTEPIPKAWLVMHYVHAHGWPAVASAQVCNNHDAAVAYAKRCAIVSPGVNYVVFQAIGAWKTSPGEPIEEQLL